MILSSKKALFLFLTTQSTPRNTSQQQFLCISLPLVVIMLVSNTKVTNWEGEGPISSKVVVVLFTVREWKMSRWRRHQERHESNRFNNKLLSTARQTHMNILVQLFTAIVLIQWEDAKFYVIRRKQTNATKTNFYHCV